MYAIAILAEATNAASGNMVTDLAKQFGVTWPMFISQLIAFLVLAFLLHRFAYQPLLKVLEERKRHIADGLAHAEKVKVELHNAQSATKELLDKASADASVMLVETRAAAAKVHEAETQKAIAAAQQILTKAKEQSEAERERLKAELMHEMGRLVVLTTVKVTGKVLTAEDQKRLVDEANREIASAK